MPPTGDHPEILKKRKGPRFRRFEDRAVVRALVGVCTFLFVVVAIMGYAQFNTLNKLDDQNDRFTQSVCTQALTLKQARRREAALSKTDSTRAKRRAHSRSAAQIKRTIAFFNSIVECDGVKVSLPIQRPSLVPRNRR